MRKVPARVTLLAGAPLETQVGLAAGKPTASGFVRGGGGGGGVTLRAVWSPDPSAPSSEGVGNQVFGHTHLWLLLWAGWAWACGCQPKIFTDFPRPLLVILESSIPSEGRKTRKRRKGSEDGRQPRTGKCSSFGPQARQPSLPSQRLRPEGFVSAARGVSLWVLLRVLRI